MTQWVTIAGPLAVCEVCDWGVHGDALGAQALALLARRHADETGHLVRLERGQTRYCEPKDAG